MSSSKKDPLSPLEIAVDRCQKEILGLCWEGDYKGFHETFSAYLKQWSSQDPHGRQALEAAFTYGALSFQSMSTDTGEIYEQKRLRWSAWLSLLPLDMQLSLLLMSDSREQHVLSFQDIKWSQATDVQAAPDPERAFRASPLGGWRDDKTPGSNSPHKKSFSRVNGAYTLKPASWGQVKTRVHAQMNHYATSLVAWKEWEKLEEWMSLASIQACAPLGKEVYVHHRTTFSRGSTLATVLTPLPFWTVGVFTGATEEAFWDAMQRAGGINMGASRARKGHVLIPEGFLLQPLANLELQARLEPSAQDSVARTAAAWRQRFLEEAVPPIPSTQKAAPRF